MTLTLSRKARSLLRLPLFVQCWLPPLWLVLGLSKALILTTSFRRLAPYLGQASGVAPWVPLLTPVQQARARQIGRAVQTAARYTPWDANCFPQALAARWLLGLYGIPYTLCFGIRRDLPSGQVKAHAWVAAGRVQVSGGASFAHYTVVGVFVSSSWLAP